MNSKHVSVGGLLLIVAGVLALIGCQHYKDWLAGYRPPSS